MSKAVSLRRRSFEKELRLAGKHVRTKSDYESTGATYLGTVGAAAQQGYYTMAACERKQVPVTSEELRSILHFAMLADCYTDQCIIDQAGRKHRPCLPVFFRTVTAEERNEEDKKR